MNISLKTPPGEILETSQKQESPLSGRIMIVHAETDFRHMAAAALTNLGYEVNSAESCIRAWKDIHLKTYDLVIIDHQLPKLTGLQLAYKLRMAEFEMPIILASIHSAHELMAKNDWLKPATIISKPFMLRELIHVVREYLPASSAGQVSSAAKPYLPERMWAQQNYRFQ